MAKIGKIVLVFVIMIVGFAIVGNFASTASDWLGRTSDEALERSGYNRDPESTTAGNTDEAEEETAATLYFSDLRGVWQGDTFRNEFANITFRLPEDGYYLDDEELAAFLGYSVDYYNTFSDTQLDEDVMQMMAFYDMAAVAPDGSTVGLMLERGGFLVSETIYLNNVCAGLNPLEMLEPEFSNYYPLQLGEETYLTVEVSFDDIYYQYYCVHKQGNYFAAMIFIVPNREAMENMAACFV